LNNNKKTKETGVYFYTPESSSLKTQD